MKVLLFKTDIANSEQIELIRDSLNHALGFRDWSFDIENKVFRVEVLTTSPEEIIELLKRLGVNCASL